MGFDTERWKQLHRGGCMGRELIYKDSTDSTNLDAARLSAELPHGAVIVAGCQSAGRGRRGRTWVSDSRENLYFSLLLKPDMAPDKASMLTLVMALAVAEGIEQVYGCRDGEARACIKWPNDIVIRGRKVCGILTEMQLEQGAIGHVVIGVGVNVHRMEFTGPGLEYASSLEAELGEPVAGSRDFTGARERLLNAILVRFEAGYEEFCSAGSLEPLRAAYEARLANCNREVCVLEPVGSYTGLAEGIDAVGRLIVRLEDGSRTYVYAGEVSVRGIYGYV